MNGSTSAAVVRAAVIVTLGLVAMVLVGLIAYAISRGENLNSSQIVALLGSVTVLVGLIAALAQGFLTAAGVQILKEGQNQISADVKNHIQQHIGHTDAEISAMIEEKLQRRFGPPPPAVGGD